jgi:N-acetylglucosamine-6-sulfatase
MRPDVRMPPGHIDKRLVAGCLALLGAVAAGMGLGGPSSSETASAAAPNKPDRPNIVLVQTDDQTLRQFTAGVMPNTQRILLDNGTKFTNYLATTGQCCPSRTSLITGQYAHNHGVTSNNVGYRGLDEKQNVLPTWLRNAGYRTMHVGAKYINGYPGYARPSTRVAPGWDKWYTAYSPTSYYDYKLSNNGEHEFMGNEPDDYSGRVLAEKAAHLIETYGPTPRPFYLQLDTVAPHIGGQDDPYGDCDGKAIPDPRDEGLYGGASLPEPPSFNESDMADKPPFLSKAPPLTDTYEQRLLAKWRCALGSLTGVDRTVARLFTAVKRTGELSRTVFVYVSDNGLFYGEHRIKTGKVFPYEEALHLPFLMRVPARYRDFVPRVAHVDKLVGNIDIAPTILDLARADPCRPRHGCRTMDGRSVMPLLRDHGRWPDDRALLTEYREPGLPRYSTCEFAGIRTRDEIYVEHYRVANGVTGECDDLDPPDVELYNLDSDPFELDNLCFAGVKANCRQDEVQADLERRLAKLRVCAGIRGRDEKVEGRPYCE